MKKMWASLAMLILSCTVFLISCSFTQKTGEPKYEKYHPRVKAVAEKENNASKKMKDREKELSTPAPSVSGPTEALPWAFDEKFQKAQLDNGTPVLMAGFMTVLKDPLPGEEFNVHLAADMLCGIIVPPGKVFSQNGSIGPYTEDRGFQKGPTYLGAKLSTTVGGGVCKIASTLYNVSVLSNLQVIERFNHSMPVPYVPYGQDATVAYGGKDFKFKNNTDNPVLLWAKGIDNVLYMGFYSKEKAPSIKWHHEFLSRQPAQVIYKTNNELPEGVEKKVLDGMDGAVVKSWVTIQKPDGTVETRQMGVSSYNPMSHIVEKGSKQ